MTSGEMIDTIKAFIETGEEHPGVYYENPKTHEFEENASLSMGFKSRGININKKIGDTVAVTGEYICNL